MEALKKWFRTADAFDVLDDAVMGSLLDSVVCEICEDFGVTRSQFGAALVEALDEGY